MISNDKLRTVWHSLSTASTAAATVYNYREGDTVKATVQAVLFLFNVALLSGHFEPGNDGVEVTYDTEKDEWTVDGTVGAGAQ